MRIFLTGGTGFIGSYVLKLALEAGHHVTAIRRCSTSGTVIPLPCNPLWLDIPLNDLREENIHGHDAVIHLASVGVSPQNAALMELVSVNIWGSVHLAETAREAGVNRLIYAGTSHEYGRLINCSSQIPATTSLDPLSLYGASKASAFHLVSALARRHGLCLYYGRIFNAYGIGQNDANFWPSLRRAALSGNDFPMSTGSQVLDFVPVEMVASRFLNAATDAVIAPGIPLVQNIGSGAPSTLLSFAESEWLRLGAKGSLKPGLLSAVRDNTEI